jgi:hypothetical protein
MRDPEFAVILPNSGLSFPTDGFYNLLFHIVFTHPQTRRLLKTRICTLISSDLWTNQVENWIEGYQAYLAPVIALDERDRIDSVDDFNQGLETLLEFKSVQSEFLFEFFSCDID